jgi:hypothetical protein
LATLFQFASSLPSLALVCLDFFADIAGSGFAFRRGAGLTDAAFWGGTPRLN